MNTETFKIYCRAYFPDCTFYEGDDMLWCYNNGAIAEDKFIDDKKLKFSFYLCKSGWAIFSHEGDWIDSSEEIFTITQFKRFLKILKTKEK